MGDPLCSSQPSRPCFVRSLTGRNSNPIIPEAFFTAYLNGKPDLTKLKLTSDASDRTWDVKLNGRRFAGGWEDFSAAHCLRNDDVLVFRHHGEMVFHVTPSGRSFSQIQCKSSSSGDETGDDESHSKKSCLLRVTLSNLRLNRVDLSKHFSRTNGLAKRCCEIDLMNLSGESWALALRHNDMTGQDYILGGWTSFCHANELKPGSLYRFKRPLLRLCSEIIPGIRANGKANVSEHNKFLTVTFKHYMLQSGHLCLPKSFARENGIKEAEEIILVDKNGVKWPSYVASPKNRTEFYMAHGWRGFCDANKLKMGETFTLEFVRGEGTTPMLKFCSKAMLKTKQEEAPEEMVTPYQKRARVSAKVGHSRRTQAPNRSSDGPKRLQRKQPLPPCSFSDQAKRVKHSIVNILTGIKRFRSELEIKERNLEASLLEIDALGEKVLEINNILK